MYDTTNHTIDGTLAPTSAPVQNTITDRVSTKFASHNDTNDRISVEVIGAVRCNATTGRPADVVVILVELYNGVDVDATC
jgi:hypothetical protein